MYETSTDTNGDEIVFVNLSSVDRKDKSTKITDMGFFTIQNEIYRICNIIDNLSNDKIIELIPILKHEFNIEKEKTNIKHSEKALSYSLIYILFLVRILDKEPVQIISLTDIIKNNINFDVLKETIFVPTILI